MNLLDTSVLVDIDRGTCPEKVERLDDAGKHAISMVTVTELHHGVEKKYGDTDQYQEMFDSLERLLARFEVLPVSRSVAVTAARIVADLDEKRRPVDSLHDSYVASTALVNGLTLLTANGKHFEPVEGLLLEDWETF
jgi:tRNA(fMet)-specific endonuclease VapC